ncbi:MAG: hypothetical protein K0S23_3209 [Fluviicola sp.]|jgi:hypothetical protein|nr:hypothetical protein [Fluviicola sp.]
MYCCYSQKCVKLNLGSINYKLAKESFSTPKPEERYVTEIKSRIVC